MDKDEVLKQIHRYSTFDVEAYDSTNFNQWNNKWDESTVSDYHYEDMLLNVMLHLERTGGVEFAILKDPELGKWWARKSKELAHQRKKVAAIDKLKASMTKEELKLLGINI